MTGWSSGCLGEHIPVGGRDVIIVSHHRMDVAVRRKMNRNIHGGMTDVALHYPQLR
jgi:hypothetical protein